MWRLKRWSLLRLFALLLALSCLSGPVGLYGEETYTISERQMRELSETIESLRAELTDLQQSYRLLKLSAGDLTELSNRYAERLVAYKQRTRNLEQTINSLQNLNETLQERLGQAAKQLTELQTELATLRQSFETYKEEASEEIRGAWFKGGALGFGAGVVATILFGLLGGLR